MIMMKEVYFRELGHKITELANLESVSYRLETQMGFDGPVLRENSSPGNLGKYLKAFILLDEAHLHCAM